MMKTTFGFVLVFGFLLMWTVIANANNKTLSTKTPHYIDANGPVGVQVVLRIPSAPRVKHVKPECPGPNYFWIKPHWKWNKHRNEYVYAKGRWEKARKGYKYVPGSWRKVRSGYKWKAGVWIKL